MKKFAVLTLVLFLLISCIAGCSSPSAATSGPAVDKPASQSGAATDNSEAVTLSMFVDETWWPYDTWNGDMPRWFTEKTGVTFDVTIAADATELSMMVASATYPDIVVTNQFKMMSNPAVSYTWDELISENQIDMTIHPAYNFVNASADGKMYTIKIGWSADYEYEQYPTVNPEGTSLIAREDILEAVLENTGLDDIRSLEDLETCFEACKTLYPEVAPFIIQHVSQLARNFQAWYGAGLEGFVDVDGKAQVYIYHKNLEDALLKMNEWYRKGYILEENLSWNSITTAQEWQVAGKAFTVGTLTSGAQNSDINCAQAGVDYTWKPLTSIYTDSSAEYAAGTGWRGFYITKNCSNPKAAIEAALFLYSKDDGYAMLWGEEGVDWNWNADHTEVDFHYTADDAELKDRKQLLWGWLGHDGISNNMQYMNSEKTRQALQWVGDIIVRNPVLGIVMNQMDSDSEENVIYENIRELERTQFLKIISAGSAEEAQAFYNEMIEIADTLGGQTLNDWANQMYPDFLAQYDAVRAVGAEGWEK